MPEQLIDENTQQYLVFELSCKLYGIAANNVKTIVLNYDIIAIPNSIQCVLGAMNLAGVIIPIIHVRRYLNLIYQMKSFRAVIIFKYHPPFGIAVDNVPKVYTIPKENIHKLPQIMQTDNCINKVIKINKLTAFILQMNKILPDLKLIFFACSCWY